jgi:hypothetical protein
VGTSTDYLAIANATAVRSVNVVLIPGGILDLPDVLGMSGGIPGPLLPFDNKAVTVSLGEHAGSDLRFTPAEARLLGETIAHEVGHYLGLFHPVESIDLTFHDALADTPDCTTVDECEDLLGSNLMFPYPVCDVSGCLGQGDVSDAQGSALNRYAGVR